MSSPSLAPAAPPRPLLDSVFGQLWPDQATPGRPRLVAAGAAAGLFAAATVPFRLPGLATFLAALAVTAVVAAAGRGRVGPRQATAGALCLLLAGTLLVRDAAWLVVLCLMAAVAVGAGALAGGRSVAALLASTTAVPMAAVRGLPWLGRSLHVATPSGRPAQWWAAFRTTAVTLALVAVFGALFASADALFARWLGALVPDLTVGDLLVRSLVFVAVTGLTLAGVYVALCPPQVERLSPPAGRSVTRAFEWLLPVGAAVGLFTMFVAAQLTVMFGGHAYLRRTTGLTYAEYVHQGFGQLTVATLLTLAVVAMTLRKAPRESGRDRMLLRVSLGALLTLTLVVVGSALYRMHVYEQAYGFTRLRILVSVFEAWLGAVVVLVMAAGARLRGPWVPWAALASGAVMLLGLAAVNPDGYIAARNIERFEQTGRVDWYYLSGLSADAVPALSELPARYRGCVLLEEPPTDDWLSWNLGRARARDVLTTLEPQGRRCRTRG